MGINYNEELRRLHKRWVIDCESWGEACGKWLERCTRRQHRTTAHHREMNKLLLEMEDEADDWKEGKVRNLNSEDLEKEYIKLEKLWAKECDAWAAECDSWAEKVTRRAQRALEYDREVRRLQRAIDGDTDDIPEDSNDWWKNGNGRN